MHETRHLIPSEENRLSVFENEKLGKIFERKSEKVAGGWRKL
jgi:hypothetical protein